MDAEPAVSLYFEDEDFPRAKQTPCLQPQQSSAGGSFSVKAKHFPHLLILCRLSCVAFLVHMLPLISFDSPLDFPLCLFPAIVRGGSSEDVQISRCLPLKQVFWKNWLSNRPCKTGAESDVVGRLLTLSLEHQLVWT